VTKLAQEHHLVKHFFIGEQLPTSAVEVLVTSKRNEEAGRFSRSSHGTLEPEEDSVVLGGRTKLRSRLLGVATSLAQDCVSIDLDISPLFDLPTRPIDPDLRKILVTI
jgi:hypothetical protein